MKINNVLEFETRPINGPTRAHPDGPDPTRQLLSVQCSSTQIQNIRGEKHLGKAINELMRFISNKGVRNKIITHSALEI